MATIKDVAREAGVSVTLVSRYINGKKGVGSESSEKISQAIVKLNFRPNQLARSLVQGKSKQIAVLLDDISNPVFHPFIKAVEEVMNPAGYYVVYLNGAGDLKRKTQYFNHYVLGGCDGIICYGSLADEVQDSLRGIVMPVVLVDNVSKGGTCDVVAVDHFRGGEILTQHLLVKCKWISYFCGDQSMSMVNQRIAAYEACIRKSVGDDRIHIVPCGIEEKDGFETMTRFINKSLRPEAIICDSVLAARGVLRAIAEYGSAMQGKILVAAFDDGGTAEDRYIQNLSVVKIPMAQMGTEAAKLIIGRNENMNAEKQQLIFSPELIIRSSTK